MGRKRTPWSGCSGWSGFEVTRFVCRFQPVERNEFPFTVHIEFKNFIVSFQHFKRPAITRVKRRFYRVDPDINTTGTE